VPVRLHEHRHERGAQQHRSALRFAWDSRYRVDVIVADRTVRPDHTSTPRPAAVLRQHDATGWRRAESIAA